MWAKPGPRQAQGPELEQWGIIDPTLCINMKASTQFQTTHLFPVPVLVSVTASVNTHYTGNLPAAQGKF